MRKMVLLVILTALAVFCLAATSSAAQYTCEINGVGVEGPSYYVYLTDANGTFIKGKCFLNPAGNPTRVQKFFATALDAINYRHLVLVDLDVVPTPTVVANVNELNLITDDF